MNPNLNNLERAIRMVLSFILLATCSSEIITGNITWLLVTLSLILAATGVWGFCPTYKLIHLMGLRKQKK